MGNTEVNKRASRLNQNSRYTRNSYSLEGNSFFSNQLTNRASPSFQQNTRRDPGGSVQAPILLDNIAQLASPINRTKNNNRNKSVQQAPREFSPEVQPQQKPQESMKRSLSVSINTKKQRSNAQMDKKLSKLNQKNQFLRKELMKISSDLTGQLKTKKFIPKIKEVRPRAVKDQPQDPLLIAALRRELETGYKQIDRLKKTIQAGKKTQGNTSKNQDLLNQIEAKIRDVEWDISQIFFQIRNAKETKKDIQLQLAYTAGIADFGELDPFKRELEKLRKLSKKKYKSQRLHLQKQRIMQQYMFQLERKRGKFTGQYLPQIKSYANKNYNPDPKHQKRKDSDFINYKPADWQVRDLLEQIRTLKHKHEEYHVKMDKALKGKTVVRQQNQRIKRDFDTASKQLQTLHYKRERYNQLVMGNLQFLMNQDQSQLEIQDPQSGASSRIQLMKTVTRGNDVPDQVYFSDKDKLKDMNLADIKIVSVNIWYTPTHHIAVMQMIYSDGKDCFLGQKSANVSGQMQKQMLQVEEGDYLKNIMGIFGRKGGIQYLAFYSAKGKARTFGKQLINGLNFTLGLSRRQRPVCLSGYTFFDGTYWRVNKLIVDVLTE